LLKDTIRISGNYDMKRKTVHVLAMRILAFSNLFGQFTPIVLSRMKPGTYAATYEKNNVSKEWVCITFVQVGIGELASNFFNDLNVIEVR
jgi:hypothetical protein